jgi:hypothetical protein
MVEQTFSINNAWSIEPPCFVRKIDRAGHWKDVDSIRDKVFRLESDGGISVYLVNSSTDLARVSIALNANRSSKIEPLLLVAITADELAGIDAVRTDGETLCRWANFLHHDLVTDPNQLARLAETLVNAGRKHHKFTKPAMQEALDLTANEGCHAAREDSERCVCESDLPASQSRSWLARLSHAISWFFGRIRPSP